MRFAGKVAIVTGSTRGVGRGIAERLGSEGCAVVITGRDEAAGAEAAAAVERLGGRARFVRADLTAEDGARAVVSQAVAAFGRLDVLVNNAAPTDVITAEDTTVADIAVASWETILRGAATATLLMSKHAIPELRRAGAGAIVNISTSVATRGIDGMVGHSASKAAIEAITRSLAVELGADNIRANTVVLGFIVSGPRQAAVAADPVRGAAICSMQLLRLGVVEDAAAAVAFLASDEAGFITGTSLVVDGGSSCRMPVAQLPGARGPVHQ
jgi:NAD(P)-dependent dehydrogenase (short-subunit alcohol dehydrogenase family)